MNLRKGPSFFRLSSSFSREKKNARKNAFFFFQERRLERNGGRGRERERRKEAQTLKTMAAYGEGLVRPRRRRKEKRGHGKEEEEEEDKESLIAAADATLGQDKRTTVPLITHGMQGTILFSFSFSFFFFFALVLEEDTRSSDAIEVLLLLVSLDSFKRKEVF